MAQQCVICGKQSIMVWKLRKLRGKYNPTVKNRKHPNLQWTRLTPKDAKKAGLAPGVRVKACAKCIKASVKKNLKKARTLAKPQV